MQPNTDNQGALVVPPTKGAIRAVSKDVREAKDAISRIFARMRNDIATNGSNYRRKINEGGLNVMALVINVWPLQPGAYSRSAQVMFWNLKNCNVPEEHIHDDYIEIPVLPEKQKTTKTQAAPPPQAKQQQQLARPGARNAPPPQVNEPAADVTQYIRIYEREIRDVSMEPSSLKNVSAGDIIEIINVVAKEHTKDQVVRVFVNAQLCKKTGVTNAEIYEALTHVIPKIHFEPLKKRPNGAVVPKFDEKLLIFSVSNTVKDEDYVAPSGVIIEPQISDNEKDWATSGTPPRILFRSYHSVAQWTPPARPDTAERVMLDLTCFHEALSGFYIADIQTWRKLGPSIVASSPYIVVGRTQINSTESFQMMANDGESGLSKYNFVLSVVGNILFVDAPAVYARIGIPISAEKAKTMHMDKKAEIGPGMNDIHPFNAHATSNPPMINLYEYAGDLTHVWENPDAKYVVLVNSKMNAKSLQTIAKLTPEEGDEIVSALMGGEDISGITDISLAPFGSNSYCFNPFLIFQSKLARGNNRYVKAFLDGILHKEEDHEEYPGPPDSQPPLLTNQAHNDKDKSKDEGARPEPVPAQNAPAPAKPPVKRDRPEAHESEQHHKKVKKDKEKEHKEHKEKREKREKRDGKHA